MEQQPSKATLGDVLNAFLDIYNTPDPGVQLFVLFVLVFIGIPTVGGVLILLYNNFIACEKRPTRAFSWIPFIGTSLFYHQDPLQFLQQQAKIVGPIITVDSLKEEFVYFLEPDMLGELAQSQDVSHARYIEMRMDKLYQKGYNYSEFQLAFETFWTSSSFEANKLAIADAMEDLVMKASESPEKELFQLSADMSTAAFIILCFGEEFYKQNGEKMQKVLIACEYHMNLSINVFLRGMGVPSFLSFNSSSAADKMKAWTTEELAKDQVETHYLGYLKKNIPLASHDFICSHVCHVIIGLYTSPAALAAWTTYHLRIPALKSKAENPASKDNGKEFLKRSVKESLRLHAPVEQIYQVIRATSIQEWPFRSGSLVACSPALVNVSRNPEQDFNPERKMNNCVELNQILPFPAADMIQAVSVAAVQHLLCVNVPEQSAQDAHFAHIGLPWSSVRFESAHVKSE